MIFNKKFLLFSFFHSLDKLLMWIFPLFFLYFFNNNTLFAEIEFLISLVTILLFATELGVRNYVIYAFKEIKFEAFNKSMTILTILFLIIILFCLLYFITLEFNIIFFLIASRLLYFLLHLFILKFYRWIERPIIPLILNIVSHLFIIASITIIYQKSSIFFSQFLCLDCLLLTLGILYIIAFVTIFIILKNNFKFNFQGLLDYFILSLKFSIPIIIVSLSTQLLPHLTKLITYNNDKEIMIEFSLLLRYCIVIQLFHGLFSAYFVKTIYNSSSVSFPKDIFNLYLFLLSVIGSLVCFILIKILNLNFFSTVFLSIYIYTWCISSFLEMFFGRANQNKFILYGSILSILFYCCNLYIFEISKVLDYIFMLLTSIVIYLSYLTYILITKRKLIFK